MPMESADLQRPCRSQSDTRIRAWAACLTLVVAFGLTTTPLSAAVARFEIESRTPFANGESFGDVGAYERIVGKVYYAIDPALRQNRTIVDLDLAPRNADGKVEFSSDLCILAPRDLSRGNGAILYEVNNRGNKGAIRFFNSGGDGNRADNAGNGFLMKHGFTLVWNGWDGELLPGGERMRLSAPVATNNGQPITGLVRCEIVPTSAGLTRTPINWANHGSYRPAEKGLRDATLTVRQHPGDPRVPIPRDQWTLHVSEVENGNDGQLPAVELEFPAGLQQGQLYELIYEARDPLVHGVCFASVRDLISALKHGTGKDNPFAGEREPRFQRAHGFGISQSGRFLREFLYSGFNEDEDGRKVFEGLIPHVSGGGLGSFNHRFAQPTRHCNQHDHHDYPGDRFPFAYETQTDPLSGRTEGILTRAIETNTVPFVLHTQSAAEYWTRSGSLAHTDPLATRDAEVPETVRIYLFGGTQHGPSGYPPSKAGGKYLTNPGDHRPFVRALLLALDRWSRDGTPPPPSVYPTIRKGTLVNWDQPSTDFPKIPGVGYPTVIQQPPFLDFGPRWERERIPDVQPPRIRGFYPVLVPKVDADGNEVGCLLPAEVAVPLATHTGWNLRSAEAGAEDALLALRGSYIPFPVTKAERTDAGDPRLSLEERYGNLEGYLAKLEAQCRALESAGYLLREDVERLLAEQRRRAEPIFQQINAPSR